MPRASGRVLVFRIFIYPVLEFCDCQSKIDGKPRSFGCCAIWHFHLESANSNLRVWKTTILANCWLQNYVVSILVNSLPTRLPVVMFGLSCKGCFSQSPCFGKFLASSWLIRHSEFRDRCQVVFLEAWSMTRGVGGVLPIMDYTGRLRPKGIPFSGWRYIKG